MFPKTMQAALTTFVVFAAYAITTVEIAPAATQPAPWQPPPPPPGVQVDRDINYAAPPSRTHLLDVYWPTTAQGVLPLVVFIHGGGWEIGDKLDSCPPLPLVDRGYVVANINYRFSREAIFPAQIQDCKGAIRWLRAHAGQYHIDVSRVGVWGSSAGGHLAALLGTSGDVKDEEGTVGGNLDQSSRVQAVCDWFGPTDMSCFFEQAGSENNYKAEPSKSPLYHLFGGPISAHKDLVKRANPITFITMDAPPFLIMHGDKDPFVPLAQSRMLVDALKAAGVSCQFEIVHGYGHGFSDEQQKTVFAFFDKTLKTEPAAKSPVH